MMRIKEMFKKVDGYNELAEVMNTEKAHVWFADKICSSITDGESFTEYGEFRKYIRREYFKDVADFILNSDVWEMNGETDFTSKTGRVLTFELCIERD
jgi:hypothetical protein